MCVRSSVLLMLLERKRERELAALERAAFATLMALPEHCSNGAHKMFAPLLLMQTQTQKQNLLSIWCIRSAIDGAQETTESGKRYWILEMASARNEWAACTVCSTEECWMVQASFMLLLLLGANLNVAWGGWFVLYRKLGKLNTRNGTRKENEASLSKCLCLYVCVCVCSLHNPLARFASSIQFRSLSLATLMQPWYSNCVCNGLYVISFLVVHQLYSILVFFLACSFATHSFIHSITYEWMSDWMNENGHWLGTCLSNIWE